MARLKELRANRDEKAVQEALAEITATVQEWADGKKCSHNLLDTAVKAAGLRASP